MYNDEQVLRNGKRKLPLVARPGPNPNTIQQKSKDKALGNDHLCSADEEYFDQDSLMPICEITCGAIIQDIIKSSSIKFDITHPQGPPNASAV